MNLKEAIANTLAEIEARNPKTYQDLRNCVDAYICLTDGYDVVFSPDSNDTIFVVQIVAKGRKHNYTLPSKSTWYHVQKS